MPTTALVNRIFTFGRRCAFVVMAALTFSACAHGVHPSPPPQVQPPQVQPPQVQPPQVEPPQAHPPAAVTQPPPRTAAPLLFTATAYCTGTITASGAPVSKGIVAADPAVLPLGSVIRITRAAPYNGTYRVLDTGGLIRKQRVDLYIPDCAAARQFGRRAVHVTVIRHGR